MADQPPTPAPQPALASPDFHEFIGPHLSTLFRVARSLTRSPEDAEDLVQDTMLRAFRGRHAFNGEHPRAWLLTIMRNANINQHRRRRPSLLRESDDLLGDTDRRNPAHPSAEEVASSNSSPAWLAPALGRLTKPHVDVVALVDIDGLTYEEAGAALGIPVGTVMSRLHRARRRMRNHLLHDPAFRSPS